MHSLLSKLMCFLHAYQYYKNVSLRVKYNDEFYLAKVPCKCNFVLAGTTLAGAGTFSLKPFHLNC